MFRTTSLVLQFMMGVLLIMTSLASASDSMKASRLITNTLAVPSQLAQITPVLSGVKVDSDSDSDSLVIPKKIPSSTMIKHKDHLTKVRRGLVVLGVIGTFILIAITFVLFKYLSLGLYSLIVVMLVFVVMVYGLGARYHTAKSSYALAEAWDSAGISDLDFRAVREMRVLKVDPKKIKMSIKSTFDSDFLSDDQLEEIVTDEESLELFFKLLGHDKKDDLIVTRQLKYWGLLKRYRADHLSYRASANENYHFYVGGIKHFLKDKNAFEKNVSNEDAAKAVVNRFLDSKGFWGPTSNRKQEGDDPTRVNFVRDIGVMSLLYLDRQEDLAKSYWAAMMKRQNVYGKFMKIFNDLKSSESLFSDLDTYWMSLVKAMFGELGAISTWDLFDQDDWLNNIWIDFETSSKAMSISTESAVVNVTSELAETISSHEDLTQMRRFLGVYERFKGSRFENTSYSDDGQAWLAGFDVLSDEELTRLRDRELPKLFELADLKVISLKQLNALLNSECLATEIDLDDNSSNVAKLLNDKLKILQNFIDDVFIQRRSTDKSALLFTNEAAAGPQSMNDQAAFRAVQISA